ncbi:MAG: hypothetical protein QOF75_1337, partial [Gaiellaceae bacterium]|nr:hypothetical protein [Gaiellaceae bacterium]
MWVVRGRRWFVSPIAGCGLLAALAVTGAMAATVASAGWSLTALPRVGGATRLGAEAHLVDPSFRTVRDGGYDGQFYWGIALDPLATGAVHRMLDKPSYRYGHPLLGWLGWLLSAGQARAAAAALAILGLLSTVVAAATASWLGRRRGSMGWEGLFVALNPGLIGAAAHDLGEPLGAALLVGGLAGYLCRRWTLTWLCFACLPLAKE